MPILKDILYKAPIEEVIGYTSIAVNEVFFDSRLVKPGCLFIAIKGTQVDGHKYIEQCIAKGAKVIVCEIMPDAIESGITYIRVKDSSLALGYIAANFYNNPSEKLKLVGVTGTNGKTTTVTLLFNLFRNLGYNAGLLSTVKNQINDEVIPSTHTTPDALSLNKLLSEMVAKGCSYVFMEVSSHAVVQHRITGLTFAAGVFTNITHDHLDYHKTFDEYIKAKKGFFDMLTHNAFALVNKDDKNGMVMLQNTNAKKYSYGLLRNCDFKCRVIENNFQGLLLNIDNHEVLCKLIGTFNAYNLTCAYATAVLFEIDKIKTLQFLSNLNPPEGRFEYIISEKKITGIVDYAHTPDALQNVLQTIKDIRTGNEKVITVVGCGGDRDAAKRPIMSRIACELSDKVILTSDNPRSEDADTIIRQMKEGVPVAQGKKVLSITDRREAIKTASSLAGKGDIILVAGKGHEKYQEIKGVKYPFDDMEILTETLND
ncbi:MAG: UDP-N-acetylmuramoyl-L-alanyl-D-glutamate--2,6-diaminopimelate ligase [Bacteroidia bacterium]